MRRLAVPLILILGACGSGQQSPHTPQAANTVRAAPAPAPSPPVTPATNAPAPAPDGPRDDPGLAGLSPAQRRAYDLGHRDCSHGRYAPANHLEAYRIGCGAAHDQMESGRPQG